MGEAPMSCRTPARRWPLWGSLALLAIAALRLASLGRLSLADSTESRYASVGWHMFRTGNWVTPLIDRPEGLVPFWGKPPLQLWLTSLSYHVFGVSEWSARLPSFLVAIGVVAATAWFARRLWGGRVAVLAAVVLSSAALFFMFSGTCVLDILLTASVTGAMIAFARFAEDGSHRRAWGLGFFFWLAVGALAKGPIALVLVGLAIGAWLTLVRRWRLLAALPWFWGLLLFFAVAAPWYILAERATPGFLRYFLINEHFLRYVTEDYGDLYGNGRTWPYGASWVMLLVALLPWTVLATVALIRLFRGRKLAAALRDDAWLAYALIWGLTPPCFFMLARQVLLTYVLPGFPGLAIAAAVGLDRWMRSDAAPGLLRWLRWHFAAGGLIVAAFFVVAAKYYGASPFLAAAALLATAAFSWFAWRNTARWGSAAAIVVFGLATAGTLAEVVMLLAPAIDEQHSAKTILAALYESGVAKDQAIAMPVGETYSAIFYTEAVFHGRYQHYPQQWPLPKELFDAAGDTIFLFRRKDWNHLEAKDAGRFIPVTETAHWIACRRKGGD
jgi:4-amino-4-deoxy-L-arabinose transferase-like glycosyltransferase